MQKENCCNREFRLRKLLLHHHHPRLFVIPQWSWPPVVYVIYRWVVMMYMLVWLVLSLLLEEAGGTRKRVIGMIWFTYFTNWIYTLLTISVCISAATALHHYMATKVVDYRHFDKMPWYLRMQWVFYNAATGSTVVVAVGFWSLYATYADDLINAVTLHTHLINTLYVLADIFITATPIRLLHCWHGIFVAALYVIFAFLYQAAGNHAIYRPLDFYGNPALAAVFCLGVLAGVIVIWCAVFGLYKLRVNQAHKTARGASHGNGVIGYTGSALNQANPAVTSIQGSSTPTGAGLFPAGNPTRGIKNQGYVIEIQLD